MVMATPSPQQVGREFVRQYYTLLHDAPDVLHRFYSSGSTFVHGGVDRPGMSVEEPVVGQLEIDKKIKLLNFKDCHTKIRQVDSQATIGNGVVVQVTGELSNNGEPMRRFMQTFVLAPQTPKKFYVHNDIFRYQDEVYQDLSETESEDHQTEINHVSNSKQLNINYYHSDQQQQVINESLSEPNQLQQPQHLDVSNSSESVKIQMQELSSTTVLVSNDISDQTNNNLQNGHLHETQFQQLPERVNKTSESSTSITGATDLKENKVELSEENNDEKVTVSTKLSKEDPKHDTQNPDVKNSWAKIILTQNSAAYQVNSQQPQQQPLQQQPQQITNNSQKYAQKENGKNSSAQKFTNGSQNVSVNNVSNSLSKNKTRNLTGSSSNNTQQQQQQQPSVQHTNVAPLATQTQTPQQNRAPDSASVDERAGRYPDTHQVFVGNLSQELSETELKQFFSQYGKVVEVRINTNTKQQSGRRLPNYGFVVFDEKQSVDNLLGATKSNNLTYKTEKTEYRLNIEEKRARQGRQSGFGSTSNNKQTNRVTRSSSNGSRTQQPSFQTNGNPQKKNLNSVNTHSNENTGYNRNSNNESYENKRKEIGHEIIDAGQRNKNNSRRS